MTSQEDEEEVRSHLTLPLSLTDDATVECVAKNLMGVSRQVFNHRKCHVGLLERLLCETPSGCGSVNAS